ncbi:DUF2218 domain-containing protein [Phenylobacterium sp.]|uniref:DUF2218 domain-containing protein n=1 Tax=Phenylobacterium sp. TaxID=1871053 RepID=UPI002897393F|nr:DUF2218 domain-containing protein [Phenylobacterium sp.]
MKSSATVPTANAGRYMVQLCKHFGHKVPAEWNDHEGKITFEMGEAALRAAPETLMLVAQAGDLESLSRLEKVMDSHLKRFAFREPDMAVEWRRGA